MIPVLLLVSIFSFMIIHLAPGDPINMYIRPDMTEEEIQIIRENLGLDGTIVDQYVAWLLNVLKGNFGNSVINHQPVADQIFQKIPATLLLMGTSFVLSIVIAIPLGLVSGMKKNKLVDQIISIFSYIIKYSSHITSPTIIIAKEKQKGAFGRFIAETEYGKYALMNKFYLDNDAFIADPPSHCFYQCTLIYAGEKYGVWEDKRKGIYYISEKYDSFCRVVYSLAEDDHNENTFLLSTRYDVYKGLRAAFDMARVRFSTMRCKTVLISFLNHTI